MKTKFDDKFTDITPEILKYSKLCEQNDIIKEELYLKHNVKRGLRDLDGSGVLTGLTEISEIMAFDDSNGKHQPCRGRLFYRGIDIEDLVQGFTSEKRFGFEETTYLLLFGNLPTPSELAQFNQILENYGALPTNFVNDIILKAPSDDMMNTLSRSVLTLYSYDQNADDTTIPNVLRQCLLLIALFPSLAVYGFHAYRHFYKNESLYIHSPKAGLSTAENILHMLRPDSKYTTLEARILDVALVLHAEHGGGNNSTFATRVISSSGTDTYSTIAAALGSLKGPKHGGANIKVVKMFEDMKKNLKDWTDEDEIRQHFRDLLNKKAFDKAGLIYGMGHAVYSLSDPRADIFKSYIKKLAVAKGRKEEFELYSLVENLAPKVIGDERKIYKGVSANVDFYSGFVYSMLDLPLELYTPIFAIARISGWGAHRIEELVNTGKIIRPAYLHVHGRGEYTPLIDR